MSDGRRRITGFFDDAEDWVCNANDEFQERFDVSVDKCRKKEDEIGRPVAYSEEDGFQMVYGKKKIPIRSVIKKPLEEDDIYANQPLEHVWLEKSEDAQRFMHPLEKLSVIDEDVSDMEPVKPLLLEETPPINFVQQVTDLKELVAKLPSVDEFAASRLLNLERNSLEFLLQRFCGVTANKELELQRMAKDDEHTDSPLLEVYKRSYDMCTQLYERELLTENSYLHVYGHQATDFKAAQLAIFAGLCEWRDCSAHVEDESTGYALPNKVLLEIAKEIPASVGKLRQMLKSKHPYIERNVESVVSVIRQSMQNCEAFESAAQSFKIASPGPVIDNNIEPITERKDMYLHTEHVASLSLKENSLQVESNIPGLITVAAGFTPSSSSVKEEPVTDYISDTDFEIIKKPDKSSMVVPSRTAILDMLPADLLSRLETEVTTTITSEWAKRVLGDERFKLVLETKPVSFLRLSDSSGQMSVVWRTGGLPACYILSDETSSVLIDATGFIRDQKDHHLCWGYTLSDSISASRVLQGCDLKFTPLCTHYLCEHVDPTMFKRTLVSKDEGHHCYGSNFELGAAYIKLHGIPKERPGHEDFKCGENRPSVEDEELFFVEDQYKYHTLEQALVRLKTNHVEAGLITFNGWLDRKVYRGPLMKGARYVGTHSVIMVGCKKIDGEMVAICKSSNGKDVGFDGYIYVSLEVMFIVAGATRGAGKNNYCHVEPQHLLFDFHSIDVKRGSYKPKIQEDPSKGQDNNFFKVDLNYHDLLTWERAKDYRHYDEGASAIHQPRVKMMKAVASDSSTAEVQSEFLELKQTAGDKIHQPYYRRKSKAGQTEAVDIAGDMDRDKGREKDAEGKRVFVVGDPA